MSVGVCMIIDTGVILIGGVIKGKSVSGSSRNEGVSVLEIALWKK